MEIENDIKLFFYSFHWSIKRCLYKDSNKDKTFIWSKINKILIFLCMYEINSCRYNKHGSYGKQSSSIAIVCIYMCVCLLKRWIIYKKNETTTKWNTVRISIFIITLYLPGLHLRLIYSWIWAGATRSTRADLKEWFV